MKFKVLLTCYFLILIGGASNAAAISNGTSYVDVMNGASFIKDNGEVYGLSEKEKETISSLGYGHIETSKEIESEIKTINDIGIEIGGVKLSEFVTQLESFTSKVNYFEDSKTAITKVVNKVLLNEENIQSEYDSLGISNRVEALNEYNSKGRSLSDSFLDNAKKNGELIVSSSIGAYKASRATFLKLPGESLVNATLAGSSIANAPALFIKTTDIMIKLYEVFSNPKEDPADYAKIVAELTLVANEIANAAKSSNALLESAKDPAKIVKLIASAYELGSVIGTNDKLNAVKVETFSNPSMSDIVNLYREDMKTKIYLAAGDLLLNFSDVALPENSKGSDLAGFIGAFTTSLLETRELNTKYRVKELYEKAANLNSQIDPIVEDFGLVVGSFQAEIGVAINKYGENALLGKPVTSSQVAIGGSVESEKGANEVILAEPTEIPELITTDGTLDINNPESPGSPIVSKTQTAGLKSEAEKVRKQNLQLADEYGNLLEQGKGDSQQANDIKAQLNATGEAYRALREDIQATEPEYAMLPYATSQTVTNKLQAPEVAKNNAIPDLRVRESELRNALGIIRDAESKGASPSKINALLTGIANKLGMSTNDFRLHVENLLIVNQQELLALGEEPLKVDSKLLNKLEHDEKLTATKDNMKSELETKSREQLALQNKKEAVDSKLREMNADIDRKNNEYNNLRSQENDLVRQLSQIEQQLSNVNTSNNSVPQTDLSKFNNKLKWLSIVANIYNDCGGNFSILDVRQMDLLKQASANLFGGKYIDLRVLFKSAASMHAKVLIERNAAMGLATQGVSTPSNTAQLERQRQEILNQLNSTRNSLSQFSVLSSMQSSLGKLENERSQLAAQIEQNRQYLAVLVSDVHDLEKATISSQAPQVPPNAPYTWYGGNISSLHSNNQGTIVSRGHGLDRTQASSVGMELNPQSGSSVLSGDFKIATMSNVDSTGTYNYLSWGAWNLTSPPQLRTASNGEVGVLSGGHWVRGLGTKDIPRQGSATFAGNINGNYRSSDFVVEQGTISGTVTLNANFATEKISGNLNILHNNAAWANASFANETLYTDYGYFSTDNVPVTGTNVNGGYVAGRFFGEVGAMPVEAGGGWSVQKTDNTAAAGIFRAKKQ